MCEEILEEERAKEQRREQKRQKRRKKKNKSTGNKKESEDVEEEVDSCKVTNHLLHKLTYILPISKLQVTPLKFPFSWLIVEHVKSLLTI